MRRDVKRMEGRGRARKEDGVRSVKPIGVNDAPTGYNYCLVHGSASALLQWQAAWSGINNAWRRGRRRRGEGGRGWQGAGGRAACYCI